MTDFDQLSMETVFPLLVLFFTYAALQIKCALTLLPYVSSTMLLPSSPATLPFSSSSPVSLVHAFHFPSSFHAPFPSLGVVIDQLTDLGQAGQGCLLPAGLPRSEGRLSSQHTRAQTVGQSSGEGGQCVQDAVDYMPSAF